MTRTELKWEWFWSQAGVLILAQDQGYSEHRMGEDKEPQLVFHAEQLPALMASLKKAAAEWVPEIQSDIVHQQRVIEELRAMAAEVPCQPLPTPEKPKPSKKTGGAP